MIVVPANNEACHPDLGVRTVWPNMKGKAGVRQNLRFCTAPDGTRIAYAVSGSGPALVVNKCWISNLQYDLEGPMWPHFVADLSRFVTLIRYDERGFGLSDWTATDFSLEARVSDLEAVADAARLDDFALMSTSQGGPVAITYAIRNPDRVTRLVLYDAHATPIRNKDDERQFETFMQLAQVSWDHQMGRSCRQVWSSMLLPTATEQQQSWINDLIPKSTTSEATVRAAEVRRTIDVTDQLPEVTIPTLVLHARGDRMNEFEEGRRLAAAIPDARFVPLESENHLLLGDEPAWPGFVQEIQDFVRPDGQHSDKPDAFRTTEPLTTREVQVLRLAADGLSNEDVARRLTLSTRTVERHLSNAYRKLGVSGRSARAAAVAHILSS